MRYQASPRQRVRPAWVLLPASAYLLVRLWRRRSRDNSPSQVRVPAGTRRTGLRLLEAGARLLQARAPIGAVSTYVNGFHFRSGEMGVQMEAHHYCSVLGDDVIQCVIYDGNTEDAKLVGVEYIVSERLFRTLPEEERTLWHSHHHEVKSGQLIAPGLPRAAEHALLERLAPTYGKIWHTWDTHRGDELPLGIPALMMGFTADGQLDPQRLADRNRRFGVRSVEDRKAMVADIPMPDVVAGANAWEAGEVRQLELARLPGTLEARQRRTPR